MSARARPDASSGAIDCEPTRRAIGRLTMRLSRVLRLAGADDKVPALRHPRSRAGSAFAGLATRNPHPPRGDARQTPSVETMKFRATTMAIALAVASCQAGVGEKASGPPSPERLEYINEFKKIDKANRGQITLEEATAYYSARFAELDRNHDGFLDEHELEPMIPIMNARSARELLLKLDRNSDNRLSRTEFLILANWLFQLASSPNELALGDVETNLPATIPTTTKKEATDQSPTPRAPCPIKVPNC